MSHYTDFEEKLNYGSHFVGLVFFSLACPYMLYRAISGDTKVNIAGLIVYSIGLIAMYATSSLYHFIKNREMKQKFRTLDHMAIFLLIGGTYTPIVNQYVENPLGTIFLTIFWTVNIVGIVLKFFFTGRFKWFSVGLYVILGCSVLLIIQPVLRNMPDDIFQFVLWGGLSYLFGVIFYVQKNRKYMHSIWHVFVLLASFLHFVAIYKIAIG